MTIRVRSAHRRITDAPTAAAAWKIAKADDSREQSRMFLALARRPDVTGTIIAKMVEASRGDAYWLAAAAANPAVQDCPAVRTYLSTTAALHYLISDPARYEAQIARLLVEYGGENAQNHPDRNMIDLARTVITRQRLTDEVTAMLGSDDFRTVSAAVRSAYFGDEHWPIALDLYDAAVAAGDPQPALLSTLLSRGDAQPEHILHLAKGHIAANKGSHRYLTHLHLLNLLDRARVVPVEVIRLIPRKQWSEFAGQRWNGGGGALTRAFALAGHAPSLTHAAAFGARSEPDLDLETALIDAISTGLAEQDAQGHEDAKGVVMEAVEALLSRYPSPDFVNWAINWRAGYLTEHIPADKVRSVVATWVSSHLRYSRDRHVTAWVPVETWETSAEVLATHDWPELRALAAAEVHPEDVADAYEDPSGIVRAVLASRDDLDEALATRMATDPDRAVRAALAENPAAPAAALAVLAGDGDEAIVRTVQERFLTALA